MGIGVIIILVGGVAGLGLAASPLLWTREAPESFRRKQARSAMVLAILFGAMAVLYHYATYEPPRSEQLERDF